MVHIEIKNIAENIYKTERIALKVNENADPIAHV